MFRRDRTSTPSLGTVREVELEMTLFHHQTGVLWLIYGILTLFDL